jgi:flagellar basal-body rod protein FlgF
MENTLFIALSRQLATTRQMDLIANNLANADTAGFKGEQMMFSEYLSRATGGEPLSFVQDRALARDLRDGKLERTGAPLDLAIRGKGWFVVDTKNGERYTRDGNFKIDGEGRLVTGAGDPVLGSNGTPVVFGRDDKDITIHEDGTVRAEGTARGKIRVVSFANEHALRNDGGNLFRGAGAAQDVDAPRIAQGMIETSNVQPVVQMTEMIKALRTFQGTQQMIENEHDRQRALIDKLTNEN